MTSTLQIYCFYFICKRKTIFFWKIFSFLTLLYNVYLRPETQPGSGEGTKNQERRARWPETGAETKEERSSERTRRTDGSDGSNDKGGGRIETDGRAPPAARRPAPAQPPAPDTPGHISPPDGAQGGRVRRSEARGFHRESGKNLLFQIQIIRLLFSFEGNKKKGNRIPSDCLYILYVLSFLHTFPFSIFAKR